MPFRYTLHGLRLRSTGQIPGLVPVSPGGPADITVTLGSLPPSIVATGASAGDIWFETPYRTPDGAPSLLARKLFNGAFFRLTYSDGIDFVLNADASAIWVHWPDSCSIADVPSYLLGPVIGIALRLRGVPSLHASAVEFGDCAVAFAGPATAGKSTLAGAFAVLGHGVLSDDTLALRPRADHWFASPGYPRIRLWPRSAEALSRHVPNAPLLPPGRSGSAQRYHLDLSTGACRFVEQDRALGVIYLLEDAAGPDADFRIDAVSQSDAVVALTANMFAWRALTAAGRAEEFDALTRLVSVVPVRRFLAPPNIDRLFEGCAVIADDVRQRLNVSRPLVAS